ncbi:MAG: FAD-binding oxidoreductase [Anaeromyxobacteraceae bacterium]
MVIRERPATADDAIQGVVPRIVLEPSTVEEAAEAVARSAREKLAVAFVGGGTDLGLGARPSRLDAVLRTTSLSRLVDHAPADQVVTAEAGMTLAALGEVLARHRQRLSLDAPFPGRATVGGVVAANAFGPRRTRFGAARDLVLGVSLVRADGVPARGGGKVVKNVAGFDLPRLMVGSLGTLALLTRVTFRVHPLPEVESTVLFPGLDPDQVRGLAAAWRAAQLEPTSAAAVFVSDLLDLGVRFEGFETGVADQVARLLDLARRSGLSGEKLPPADAAGFWRRHDQVREAGALRVKVTTVPSRLGELARAWLPQLLGELSPAGAVVYPTLGMAFASGDPASGAGLAAALRDVRLAVAASGGSVVIVDSPPAIRPTCDPWGPPPASVELMRALKDRFDPEHRLAPGRFVGGI